MANWMSFTAPRRVSLDDVPSSKTLNFDLCARLCRFASRRTLRSALPLCSAKNFKSAQDWKMGANLWLLMMMYSSMRPVWDMSSMSQSSMGLPATSSRGLGKFWVRGYRRVA